MEMETAGIEKEQLMLEGMGQYFYSIKPFEITNAIGAVIATLAEYSISNSMDQNYKLYRTKEGNWYDIPDVNPVSENAVLLALKLAINSREKLEML